MNELRILPNKKFHAMVVTSAHQEKFYSISDLFIFLIQYSFLFSNNDKTQKTCTLKAPQIPAPQGNGEMGTRYLDPKYSRWISVDPALAEYIPGAGKSDEADKLPGMGGIFNSVNLSLFHYAGNNPVRYVDPDGRIDLDAIGDIIFKDTTISKKKSISYYDGSKWSKFKCRNFSLSPDALNYLQNLSDSRACTYGAICVRNETRNDKIPCIDEAVKLQASKYISYYRDESGNILNDPKKLYDIMKIGDILLYVPDNEYFNQVYGFTPTFKEIGFTGHTATIIGKGKDDEGAFFDILEFHSQKFGKPWNKATVKRIYSDTLRTFYDCKLLGGASWN